MQRKIRYTTQIIETLFYNLNFITTFFQALKDYNEAIRLEKESCAQYYYERALVYYDLEKYEAAIADFGSALNTAGGEGGKISPAQTYNAQFYRGIAYRKQDLLNESIGCLNACITIDAGKSEGHNHLGLSHAQQGKYERAKECFTAALEAHKKKADQAGGSSSSSSGGAGGASAALNLNVGGKSGGENEAVEDAPNVISSKYLNNRGLANYHMQQFGLAVEDFSAAVLEYD